MLKKKGESSVEEEERREECVEGEVRGRGCWGGGGGREKEHITAKSTDKENYTLWISGHGNSLTLNVKTHQINNK